jgi:hypothetical protein
MFDLPYISENEVVTANDEYLSMLADQVEVARLRPTSGDLDIKDEWTMSSAGGVTFEDVAFKADDEEAAVRKAKQWLAVFFEREPDQIP